MAGGWQDECDGDEKMAGRWEKECDDNGVGREKEGEREGDMEIVCHWW